MMMESSGSQAQTMIKHMPASASTSTTPLAAASATTPNAPSNQSSLADINVASSPPQTRFRTELSSNMHQMELMKQASKFDLWHWDENNKSDECQLSKDGLDVCFHPECSQSAAAIRGTKPFARDGNYYYWEVTVLNKVYGTSVMFGVCTKDQKMDLYDYRNLIGLDENGWSLSHKGFIWHNNKSSQYTKMFQSERSVTIGMLLDTLRGTLSFFKDGKNLGVAFCGLNQVDGDLYPVIGSTAKCTRMRLEGSYCGYMSLKERASFTLMKHARDRVELLRQVTNDYHLPNDLFSHLVQTALVCSNQAAIIQQRSLPEENRSLVIDYERITNNHISNNTQVNDVTYGTSSGNLIEEEGRKHPEQTSTFANRQSIC